MKKNFLVIYSTAALEVYLVFDKTVNATFSKFLIGGARVTPVWPESTGRYSGSVDATDCGNPGYRNFPRIKFSKTYFIR